VTYQRRHSLISHDIPDISYFLFSCRVLCELHRSVVCGTPVTLFVRLSVLSTFVRYHQPVHSCSLPSSYPHLFPRGKLGLISRRKSSRQIPLHRSLLEQLIPKFSVLVRSAQIYHRVYIEPHFRLFQSSPHLYSVFQRPFTSSSCVLLRLKSFSIHCGSSNKMFYPFVIFYSRARYFAHLIHSFLLCNFLQSIVTLTASVMGVYRHSKSTLRKF
jgi:hypothetical protein